MEGSAGYAEEAVGALSLLAQISTGQTSKVYPRLAASQGKGEVLLSADKHLALSDLSLFGTRAECRVGGLLQQQQHSR